MPGLIDAITRTLSEIEHAKRIPCPHCGEILIDEDREFASLDGGQTATRCPECGGGFVVVEEVQRRYSTMKMVNGRAVPGEREHVE